MGFGFNMGLTFIAIPLLIIVILLWLFTKNPLFGKLSAFIILGAALAIVTGLLVDGFTAKIKLKRNDFYGHYTIGRNFYPGTCSNWQYNSFRFVIKSNDSIYFYLTDKQRTIKTYKGIISTVNPYDSERLVIQMDQPGHHVLSTNPTLYRSRTGFYLVFNSSLYKNMFFIKAKWKPLAY